MHTLDTAEKKHRELKNLYYKHLPFLRGAPSCKVAKVPKTAKRVTSRFFAYICKLMVIEYGKERYS